MSLKIPLTAAIVTTCFAAWTQPVPAPGARERQRTESFIVGSGAGGALEFITSPQMGPYTSKVLLVAGSLVEIAVAYASHSGNDHPVSYWIMDLAFTDRGAAVHINTSGQFIAGAAIAIIGSLIRLASFRAMGQQFTFQFTMRDNHKLVKNGPYSIVRHPSYTGLVMGFVGVTMCLFSKGTWWTEAGILQTLGGKLVAALWVILHTMAVVVCSRAYQEEAMLKTIFGKEWEDYVGAVKWRFIPGIL